MKATRDRLVRALLEEWYVERRRTPGTLSSFSRAFDVPRYQMRAALKSLARSGLLKAYMAHGELHYVLNVREF